MARQAALEARDEDILRQIDTMEQGEDFSVARIHD
jgi:hypothetical protein